MKDRESAPIVGRPADVSKTLVHIQEGVRVVSIHVHSLCRARPSVVTASSCCLTSHLRRLLSCSSPATIPLGRIEHFARPQAGRQLRGVQNACLAEKRPPARAAASLYSGLLWHMRITNRRSQMKGLRALVQPGLPGASARASTIRSRSFLCISDRCRGPFVLCSWVGCPVHIATS